MSEKTFAITVKSPYGSQPVEQFEHFIRKVADESEERWGIEIVLTEETEEMDAEFE